MTRAICPTELYAIRALISVWRMQIQAVAEAPQIEIATARALPLAGFLFVWSIRSSIPYPPSFRRTPARIIEPAIGASTWALGSHRCAPYMGIFTRKASMIGSHQKGGSLMARRRLSWPPDRRNIRRARSRGILADTVYIIRYIPACSRSG